MATIKIKQIKSKNRKFSIVKRTASSWRLHKHEDPVHPIDIDQLLVVTFTVRRQEK